MSSIRALEPDADTTEPADSIAGLTDRLSEWFRRRGALIEAWWTPKSVLRREVPRAAVLLGALAYFVVFYRLVWVRHDHFGTFDYDLGMYDQGIWLLSRGSGFMTVRGMQVFGHHANLGYLLFVPAYWLKAGPQFLDFMNTLGVVGCVIPIYFLGRHHLKSDWAGFWLSFAFLFHYVPQWMIQETFHPENMAAPFILGAFYFATVKKWRPYWCCIVAALIWKEDVALVVAMLGVVVFFLMKDRRRGVWTLATGAAWFVVATRVIIPLFSPNGAVYDDLFGALGSSATDVVLNTIRHPAVSGHVLMEHGADKGAFDMMKPYLFTSVASPFTLLLGLPQHVVNFLSAQSFTYATTAHYAMFPFISVTLASIRTAATRSRHAVRWGVIVAMVVGVLLTKDAGVGPWSSKYATGIWPLTDAPHNVWIREMMKKIPDDAVVSADYYLVPHLSHRHEIYTFPNPWISQNFGVGGKPRRSPDRIQYLMVATAPMQGAVKQMYDSIVASDQFVTVEQHDDLVLLKRRTG